MKSLISLFSFLSLLAGWLWLCLSFPQVVTGLFETLAFALIVLLVTAPVVGPILAGLAAVFSSRPPADLTPAQPTQHSRPPTRHPDPASARSLPRLVARRRPERPRQQWLS
jgi:hypothetical protein